MAFQAADKLLCADARALASAVAVVDTAPGGADYGHSLHSKFRESWLEYRRFFVLCQRRYPKLERIKPRPALLILPNFLTLVRVEFWIVGIKIKWVEEKSSTHFSGNPFGVIKLFWMRSHVGDKFFVGLSGL